MSLRRISKFSPKPTGAGLVNLKPTLRMADGGDGLSTAERIARTRQATYQVKQGDPVVMSQGLPTNYPSNTDLFMNSVDQGLTSVGNSLRSMVGRPQRQAPDIQAQAMAMNKMFAPVEPSLRQPVQQPVEAPPEIRFNSGGDVPGRGKGDKVPALYEPGEFVVSNDMLDAAPSLRGQLHELRENVLAQKGMTPEQADAKAMTGAGLRAINAGDWTARELTGQGNMPKPTPMGAMAEQLTTPKPAAAPVATGPVNPNVGATGSAEAQAFRAGRVPPVAAPTVAASPAVQGPAYQAGKNAAGALRGVAGRAVPIIAGGMQLADGIDKGDGWGIAKGVGDMTAGAALATPAAPIASAYLGARGLYEGGKAVAGMVADYAMKNKDQAVADMLRGPKAAAPVKTSPQPAAAPTTQTAPGATPAPELLGQQGREVGKTGAYRFDVPGKNPLYTDKASLRDSEQMLSRPAMSASDPGMQGIQDRQDASLNSLRNKTQYDQEVAAADKVNEAGRRMNLEYGARRGNMQDARTLHAMDAMAAGDKANAVTLRGQDMKLRGEMYQTDGAARTAAAQARYTSLRDERAYRDGRSDKAFEQGNAADKAQNDMFQQMFRTRDNDGKDVPDTQKIARYTVNAQNTLPDIVDALQRTGTPEALRKAADISARGLAALDKSDHAQLAQMQDIQDRLEGTHGTVFGSTHKRSASLMGYRQKEGTNADDGDIQYANGSKAPTKHMAYTEPGNFIMPDWFKQKTDQYTRGQNLRSN